MMALSGRFTAVVTCAAIVALLMVFVKPQLQESTQAQQNTRGVNTWFQGVSATEILFGISAPFSGAAKELGRMKVGIEAAFNAVNAAGGVHGRKLRLIAADDGYEPARTAETMKQLYERDQVIGITGNVGTPTAEVALAYALRRTMLFF